MCVFISDGHGQGEAYQYFLVNISPHYGTCFIQPTEGNELDQIFQANCKEWVDDNDVSVQFTKVGFIVYIIRCASGSTSAAN